MTYDLILKDIKAGKLQPVYFLHGEEPYFIDKISDYIEENLLNSEEKAFNQITIYGKEADFKVIVDEARQYPMMASRRVVILKEAQDMKTLPELASYLENPSAHSILVLCYKYKKLDKRTKFAKLLDKNAVVFESAKLYDNKMSGWINTYFKEKGHHADAAANDMLAEYLGNDLSKVSNELDKLMLNIPVSKTITPADVKEQIGISKDFNVFELQTALGTRNFVKAGLIIKYFGENPKNNPSFMLTGSLFNYFNKVFIVKVHHTQSDTQLAKMLGLSNQYFLHEYKLAAKNYDNEHLKSIFQAIKKADKFSKGVGSRHTTDWSILKDLLIACMNG